MGISGGDIKYSTIGSNVTMYSNFKILGKSIVGNNVIIAADIYVKDDVIPDNSIAFGQSPNLVVKTKTKEDILLKINA